MPDVAILPLLTLAEAAREANVSYNTVRRAVDHNELVPFQNKPHTILIPSNNLKSWINYRSGISEAQPIN